MRAAIQEMFAEFKVPVVVDEAVEGLRNYHFYLTLTKPVRMKQFQSYVDDLRYALSSDKVEIQAPIPDQKRIGITVPKKAVAPALSWREAIDTFDPSSYPPLTVPFGVGEFGEQHTLNVARLPHALIAGTTGAGKSSVLHSIICSLITHHTPETVRLIAIDPKRVEFACYNELPHLMTDVITDSKKALLALKWAVKEMERRYDVLQATGCMNIGEYHSCNDNPDEPMPYICIAIDEMADLMHSYPREFEAVIIRLAQMSRSVGIHLLIATQRPSVNVITGSMKANIPTRIALAVASQIDSRTIIDQTGAEKLAGSGDALLLTGELGRPVRVQALSITPDDITNLVGEYIAAAEHAAGATIHLDGPGDEPESFFAPLYDEEDDDLYEEAKQAVLEAGKASTSYLQRKLKLGYSRCARLIDLLEERGVIGPQIGAQPREVFIKTDTDE
jgi:S-DNA-T family DNA segregation ATPase FtsK/SpoIIIE